MIYLSGVVRAEAPYRPDFGYMMTPAIGNSPVCLDQRVWASDTGCFAQGEKFRVGRYVTWLEERVSVYRSTCLFATAPDVLGDAEATWRRSAPIFPVIRSLGYRAALVAQNGIDPHYLEWDAFDTLFLGGDTSFKLSPATHGLVQQAKARGKWVHMGRVNSFKRLQLATHWGCDSADGTYIRFAPNVYLPRVCGWLDRLNRQPVLLAAN